MIWIQGPYEVIHRYRVHNFGQESEINEWNQTVQSIRKMVDMKRIPKKIDKEMSFGIDNIRNHECIKYVMFFSVASTAKALPSYFSRATPPRNLLG